MTIRINHKQKKLQLSVRDLVLYGIHKNVSFSYLRFKNTKVGQEVHKEIQSKKMAENQNYQTEYFVKHHFRINDWKISMGGRIDLIDMNSDPIKIEEIKSTFLRHYDGSYQDSLFEPYILQLRCYAWLVKQIHPSHSSEILKLLLINQFDNTRYDIEIPYLNIYQYIEDRIIQIIQIEESRQTHYEKKVNSLKNLHFPFNYRSYQEEIVNTINSIINQELNGIIEAPSGLGKTVVTLFPLISVIINLNTKLFFLTSKTTQQRIVEDTLTLFHEQGVDILVVSLKAKEKMCTNTFYFCHEEFCPFLKNYIARFPQDIIQDFIQKRGLICPEDIEREAIRTQAFCPFELALDISLHADIIVGDYNYVFHPRVALQRFFGEAVPKNQKYFLIIDEAHNLVNRSLSYYSPILSQKAVFELKKSMRQLKKQIKDIPLPVFLPSEIEKIFRSLNAEFGTNVSTHIIDNINLSIYEKIMFQLDKDITEYVRFLMEQNLHWPDDPIISFYYHFKDFYETLLLTPNAEEFSILYNSQEGNIKILCKDASPFLKQRLNFFRSVITISATLTPFPFYRDLLGLPVEKTVFKSFPSPFPPKRRKIIIIPEIDTRYRQREHYYGDIAHLIQEVLKIRKGRYFAFFPSFNYAEKVFRLLKPNDDYLILRQEVIMLEKDRKKFITKLETTPFVLAIGVTAGIFAEGIDFPGILDGIFIISPSLPPVSFEREILRQYYEERFSNGFAYAYQFPGLTRTFQAAGRLIRTASDRGIIVLIGYRFATSFYANFFPSYYYEENPKELISTEPLNEIKEFWKNLE